MFSNIDAKKSGLPMLKPDDSLFIDLTPTVKKERDRFLEGGSASIVDKSKST